MRKGWKPRLAVLFGVVAAVVVVLLIAEDGSTSMGARERGEIEGDIEGALCRKATGKPCGI